MDAHRTVLKELEVFLGEKINTNFDEACIAISGEWRKLNPKTNFDFLNFYKNSKNYIYEIASWNDTPRKRRTFKKVLKIIKQNNITEVLDFGGGVGSDSIGLMENFIDVKYIEINEIMKRFFVWRCKKRGLEPKIIDDIDELKKVQCIMFLDVIEHFENPFEYLNKFSKKADYLLFTQAFGVHEKGRGGTPQHTDFKMEEVHKHLESLGFKKVKLNVPYPPRLYKKQEGL